MIFSSGYCQLASCWRQSISPLPGHSCSLVSSLSWQFSEYRRSVTSITASWNLTRNTNSRPAPPGLCCSCSVAKLYPTLCDPVDCSTPGPLVPHYLPEFARVHVHCISDAIQPSHFLPPSFPLASNLSWQQGLSQQVS